MEQTEQRDIHNDERQPLFSQNNSPVEETVQNDSKVKKFYNRYCNRRFFNLLVLSLSFMFLFASYSTASKYVPLIHGNAGYWSQASLYITFALISLIAPTMETKLGPRLSLPIAAFPYILYVLATGFDYDWLLIVLSIGVGFGAALLWIAQGHFLTMNAESEIGLYSGIFFATFQMNNILGNILAASLFRADISNWIVFVTLFGLGLIGTVLLLFLRPVNSQSTDKKEPKNFRQALIDIKDTIFFLFSKKMLLLFFVFTYNGISSSLFGTRVYERIGKYRKDLAGWSAIAYGISGSLGSIFIGKLIDIFGIRIMFIATFVIHAMTITMTFLMDYWKPYLFFVTTACSGLANNALYNVIYAILGSLFKNESANAFAVFKLEQSLAVALGMVAGASITFFVNQLIVIGLAVVAILSFFIVDRCIQKIEKKVEPENK